ncbi:MAG: ATP-binding protein [Planctomycetes bacterium]|nr:ATP-binding protein [Planctomycetota bacterium]
MVQRLLKLPTSSSFFLFGARGTGKSTLLRERFASIPHLLIDLLEPSEFQSLSLDPQLLIRRTDALPTQTRWVVIDEVQRLPNLLDAVHRQIESRSLRFALTGSSARKLKTQGANLLAGRAAVYYLFPFCAKELGSSFDLDRALAWGTLPILERAEDDDVRRRLLQAYTHTYLREEIQQEQLVRRVEPFHRFLLVAAQKNGQIVNYSAIARDCGVNERTVRTYFEILEDTLIGFLLPSFHESVRKRQRENPKFYFFDAGVVRALAGNLTLPVVPGTSEYGRAFESFVIHEIHRWNHYFEKDWRLSYLRTKDDAEIDLIVERPGKPRLLLEIKSTDRLPPGELNSAARLAADISNSELLCVSRDPRAQQIGSARAIHWSQLLGELVESW